MNAALLPTRPGHAPSVSEVGWGEPPTFYVECTCGWRGITIDTPRYEDPAAEVAAMVEPYRSIAETYGRDVVLADNTAYGTRDDAYRQVLAHLEYDPTTDEAVVRCDLTQTMDMVQATLAAPGSTLSSVDTSAKHLRKALTDLTLATRRLRIWGDGTLPTLPNRNPEGLRLIAEAENRTI